MERGEDVHGGSRGTAWRKVSWAIAAALLLLPLVAMRVTDEMAWDAADFAILGALLLGACGTFEFAARRSTSSAYRLAVAVAVGTGVLLVWLTLAVGLFGSEDDPANLMVGGVLGVLVLGVLVARCRAGGMARAMAATALAQTSAGAIALIAGSGATGREPEAAVVLTSGFVAAWLVSAWLFRKSARAPATRPEHRSDP
jgi:hypothetical protein